MVYEMKLNGEPFKMIRSGRKTVELRLFDEKRRKLNPGDHIIFTNLSAGNERIAAKIKALYRYGSFRELLSEIPPVICGNDPGTSAEEAASGMRAFYSKEQEELYGVLGIKLEVVDLEPVLLQRELEYAAYIDRLFPDGMK